MLTGGLTIHLTAARMAESMIKETIEQLEWRLAHRTFS
jgi:hypothetical protein